MTLEQLRIFAAVARTEHLTRAAEALNLTPSAVSSAVRVLEDHYGVSLFNRVGRHLEITEAGRIMQAEAEATLARAEAAEMVMADLGDLRRGTLKLRASQTIASYWLPVRLAEFRRRHPQIDLDIAIGNTETVSAAIVKGDAELGLIEGDIEGAGLTVRAVDRDELILVVAPSSPLAGRARLSTADLRETAWVLREPGSGTRQVFEQALRGHGVSAGDLNVSLALPSNEAVRAAVEAGAGATVISRLVVDAYIAADRLVEVPFAVPERAFRLVRHSERHPTRAGLAFEALLDAKPATKRPLRRARIT